jgi:hypothetical protein
MKSRFLASSVSLVVVVAASLIVAGVTGAASSKPVSNSTKFVTLMKRGVSSAYVATYKVSNYDFFSSGMITVANLPPRPGTKVLTNVEGYSSNLETSYVFRGNDGHIVQWIQDETRVSACVGGPFHSVNTSLQCSRPFQYIPSNGFGEEAVGFVPETVLQKFESFDPLFDAKSTVIFFESSNRFGDLQCIRQDQVSAKDPERENTCLGLHRIRATQSASY